MTVTPTIPGQNDVGTSRILGPYQKIVSLLQNTHGTDIDLNNPLGVNPGGDFGLNVARGLIEGHGQIIDTGINTVDNVTEAVIGEGYTTRYPFPDAEELLDVVSDSANDAAAGTGGQLLLLTGTIKPGDDTDYSFISEIVEMDGTTPVTTVNKFYRVNGAIFISVGSTQSNVGTVEVTNQSGDKLVILEPQVGSRDILALSGVKGQTSYLKFLILNTAKDGDGLIRVYITVDSLDGRPIFRTFSQRIYQGITEIRLNIPFPIFQGDDLEVVAIAQNSSSVTVNGTYELISVED